MNFLVIQHLDIESPALIADVLCSSGHNLHTVRVFCGERLPEDTRGYAGVIIMGGPQSANDTHLAYIQDELIWLQNKLSTGLPMLGICLGAQMMAKAAGARISRSAIRELGWYPVFPTSDSTSDPLFSGLPKQGMHVFQWHGETFSLPPQARLIASHPEVVQQAICLGHAQYAMQFHIEVDVDIIQAWIAAGSSERAHLGKKGIAQLKQETTLYLEEMRDFCSELTKTWINLTKT